MRRPAAWLGRACVVVLALAGATTACTAGTPRAHHRVEIRDLRFAPGVAEVQAGDTITWTNHDVVPHTVTEAGGVFESSELAVGGTFTLVAESGDSVHYICRYHPTMTGTLVVR